MMPEGLDRIKGARILVVEDSIANQTLAHDLLMHAGCHVDLAGNGMEAIEAVRNASEPYDAVLMDLQMPEVNGLQATAALRAREHGRRPGGRRDSESDAGQGPLRARRAPKTQCRVRPVRSPAEPRRSRRPMSRECASSSRRAW